MAVISPTPLTTVPPFPALSDRNTGTYNSKAYAFGTHMSDTFNAELDALASNVATNAAAAETAAILADGIANIALASANYKGLWSTLTGALNMPASVIHNGNYWALGANLANVTLAEPGISASWQPLGIGAGGAAETTSATSITLTSASYRVQAVNMTTTDKNVVLPDASTLQTGAGIFTIKNTGNTVFCVRDTAGTMIVAINPGDTVSIGLANASTAAGVWVVDGMTDSMYQETAVAVNAAASNNLCITKLTDTTALAVWTVTGFLSAAVLTVTGNNVSVGTVFTSGTVSTAANVSKTRVTAMSATQVIVTYAKASNSYPSAITLNISGGVVTAGAELVFGTLATAAFNDVSMLTSTQAIVVYRGTSSYPEARTLNVSGTTITAGAILVIQPSVATVGSVSAVSATQAIATVNESSIISSGFLLTVSGTTVTAGASPCRFAASGDAVVSVKVSSTQVLHACDSYSTKLPRYVLLEVAGSTVIVRDYLDGYGEGSAGGVDATLITPNKVLVVRKPRTASGYERMALQLIGLSDSAILLKGQSTTIKNSYGLSPLVAGVCSMSETTQLVVFHNSSSYVNACVVETSA